MSCRRRARTCRAACISLLPPRGLSTGSCGSQAGRKPTTAVRVHTARRRCLLRLLIILLLLSEERTGTGADVRVSSVRVSSVAEHSRPVFIWLSAAFKAFVQIQLHYAPLDNNRSFHCSGQVLIMGLDNQVCAHSSGGFFYLNISILS